MSAAAAVISLHPLDALHAGALNPTIWHENLAALRIRQSELAERVAHIMLPPYWTPARALDGTTTYRVEPPGELPRWLAAAGAPQARAQALVGAYSQTDRNPALTALAAGAEVDRLLTQTPAHIAIFVFVEDLTMLAAALRLRDWAAALQAGRLIFLPPGHEREELLRVLTDRPGLLPPTSLVGPMQASADRLQALSQICAEVAQRVTQQRQDDLATGCDGPRLNPSPADFATVPECPTALGAAVQEPSAPHASARSSSAAPTAGPRLAILALAPTAADRALAEQIATAARALHWTAATFTVTGPDDVHALPHVQRLRAFRPTHTLCLNQRPAALAAELLGRVAIWHLDPGSVSGVIPQDGALHLAGAPRIAAVLRERLPAAAWRELSYGAPLPGREPRDPSSSQVAPHRLVLLADLPNSSSAGCGIDQPTHKLLWDHLRARAGQDVAAGRPLPVAAELLRNTQRECGLDLGNADLQAGFVRALDHALLPAVLLECVYACLHRASADVRIIGSGWPVLADAYDSIWATHWHERSEELAKSRPGAVFVVQPAAELSPEMLHAAALGWPICVYWPEPKNFGTKSRWPLTTDMHVRTFATRRDLERILADWRANPDALLEMGTRCRAHLAATHSLSHRLEWLLAQWESSAY